MQNNKTLINLNYNQDKIIPLNLKYNFKEYFFQINLKKKIVHSYTYICNNIYNDT